MKNKLFLLACLVIFISGIILLQLGFNYNICIGMILSPIMIILFLGSLMRKDKKYEGEI